MESTIIVELNGVKYLLVERLITRSNIAKMDARRKRHGVIYQGIKKIDTGGFFTDVHVIATLLVPEKNVIAWDNDDK